MDAEPLPELEEGLLDEAGLAALFTDVARCTELLEVLLKGAPLAHAQGGSLDLAGAAQALVSGAARGVQLRYRYQGAEWWDTLLARPEGGWKVVRMQQQAWAR